jgi:hypothetical protein
MSCSLFSRAIKLVGVIIFFCSLVEVSNAFGWLSFDHPIVELNDPINSYRLGYLGSPGNSTLFSKNQTKNR